MKVKMPWVTGDIPQAVQKYNIRHSVAYYFSMMHADRIKAEIAALILDHQGKVPETTDCGRFFRDTDLFSDGGRIGWHFVDADGVEGPFWCAKTEDFKS